MADRLARAGALLGALALGCGLRLYLHVEPRRLAPEVWAFLGGGGNSLVVGHGPEAFAADLKQGDAAMRQRRLVEGELGQRVRRILLTHSHQDHWAGLGLYPRAGAVLAHPRTRERISAWLRDHHESDRQPWVPVETELRLMLGEEEVWIRWLGVGHTDGDLVAFVPRLKLVATGDLFSAGEEPVVDAEAGGRLLELRRTLDRLLDYELEQVLPGHGPLATRAEVEATRDYLLAMEAALRDALGRGLGEEAAVQAGELALRGIPRLAPVPFRADRVSNLRSMYRELRQTAKSAAP